MSRYPCIVLLKHKLRYSNQHVLHSETPCFARLYVLIDNKHEHSLLLCYNFKVLF